MINLFGLRMSVDGMVLFLLMMGATFCLGMVLGVVLVARDDSDDKPKQ